jgi:hypothetical protein
MKNLAHFETIIIQRQERSRRKSRLCPVENKKDKESERSKSRLFLERSDRFIVFLLFYFRSTTKRAEIGFIYDDTPMATSSRKSTTAAAADDSDDDDDDDDLDLDIEIDISQLTSENKASLNKVATHYGMAFGDFARMLILDREEMQIIRENKLEREQDMPVKVRKLMLIICFPIFVK